MDIGTALDAAVRDLRKDADPEAAPIRKRYLKSPYQVLGCTVPQVRARAASVKRAAEAPDISELEAALRRTWDSPVHEDRSLATFTAERYLPLFDAAHVAGLFKDWIADSTTWDIVDTIATSLVGPVALASPRAWPEIASWGTDDWMWLRRASLIAHIPATRTDAFDGALFEATARRLLDEKEFFIRKAIGWTIRELSKADPAEAERILLALGPGMSGLTLREGSRRLPKAARARIYAAFGRPPPKG